MTRLRWDPRVRTETLSRFLRCVDDTFKCEISFVDKNMFDVKHMGEGVLSALNMADLVEAMQHGFGGYRSLNEIELFEVLTTICRTPDSRFNTVHRTNSTYGYIANVHAETIVEGAMHCLIKFLKPFVDEIGIMRYNDKEQQGYVDIAFNGADTRVCVSAGIFRNVGWRPVGDYHIVLQRPAVLGCLVGAADMVLYELHGYPRTVKATSKRYECVNTLSDVAKVLDVGELILLLILRSIIIPAHTNMTAKAGNRGRNYAPRVVGRPDGGCRLPPDAEYRSWCTPNLHNLRRLKSRPLRVGDWAQLSLTHYSDSSEVISLARIAEDVLDITVDVSTWSILQCLSECLE